ncbi:hypothetical protein Deima_0028 [Deinococcus maricopensis DSM 21211]|uniref:Uncharacterized protein n=1 Tax=Deinococcus maricopensis (strain DSM 21211 / LMG 22137 / NRRL B-23946 / LB-34) TaxID=709986 RepID=E8U3Z8_DEIML|nr:hypothetical protein Deima_0028 [Deinococcus maricopensis DSM 21211]
MLSPADRHARGNRNAIALAVRAWWRWALGWTLPRL